MTHLYCTSVAQFAPVKALYFHYSHFFERLVLRDQA